MDQSRPNTNDINDIAHMLHALPAPEPPPYLHAQVMVEITRIMHRRRTVRLATWYATLTGSLLLGTVALTHVPPELAGRRGHR